MPQPNDPRAVDAYLASVPPAMRSALEALRALIRRAAPEATEGMSYGCPAFRHQGLLVGYGAFKDHCSLLVMNPSVMEGFADDLRGFTTTKGTIHFAPAQPLPGALVERLVRARIAQNQDAAAARTATRRVR
jgi:uncharacterized protein YdhG (YjbR/CyaY superfamily)